MFFGRNVLNAVGLWLGIRTRLVAKDRDTAVAEITPTRHDTDFGIVDLSARGVPA
jgi:hypothetical protein